MSEMERYRRQIALSVLGEGGQRRLAQSAVLVVGCGGLGSSITQVLVRAGVGTVRILDPDIVELANLHRQILYDENDQGQPKAEVAARRLCEINSDVSIDAQVARFDTSNALALCTGVDLVIDGTDNVETRYLINDACLEKSVPWVYGGAVGTSGMVMGILPHESACLRCVFPQPPPTGTLPTCDTVGVLGSLPIIIGSYQATAAIKLLLDRDDADTDLTVFDIWQGTQSRIRAERADDCPACVHGKRDFLD